MSFKCIICDGGQKSKNTNNSEDNFVIALNCGHLFHKSCASTWFREKGLRQCPTCKAVSETELRVYLGDEEDLDESLNASRRELEDYTKKLEVQLEVERRRAVPDPCNSCRILRVQNFRLQAIITHTLPRMEEINERQGAEKEELKRQIEEKNRQIEEKNSQIEERDGIIERIRSLREPKFPKNN